MKKLCILLVFAAILVFTLSTSVHALLYGLASNNDSLYTIDETTGVATLEATLDSNVSFTGLAFMGDELWASDIYVGGWRTGTIDLDTGVFTVQSDQAGSYDWHGLAAAQESGLFYTIDLNDNDKLTSLDPDTGVVTKIGSGTGIQGRGMAYDNFNDILYATDYLNDKLYTVDTTTGAATEVGAFGIGIDYYVGMAYDETIDTLLLNTNGGLYTVSVSSGAATLVGSNQIGSVDIDGLASASIPDASTLLLMVTSLTAGLVGFRRKSKK